MIELFENRRLLAATFEDGTITVRGTSKDDVISIEYGIDSLLVFVNGKIELDVGGFGDPPVNNAIVRGLSGNDSITTAIPATLIGGDGRDTVQGSSKADSIQGGNGADLLRGGAGKDSIAGGAGSDTLKGGLGDDLLNGNRGDDVFPNGKKANGADTIDGGAGRDVVDYSDREVRVEVSLDGIADDGESPEATYEGPVTDVEPAGIVIGPVFPPREMDNVMPSIENIIGSAKDDTLTGNAGTNYLFGGDGDDWLTGRKGADILSGAKGRDTVSYLFVKRRTSISLDGLANDGALYPGIDGGTFSESDNVLDDIEDVEGGWGDDLIVGDAGPNWILGFGGNDTILSGEGHDHVDGGVGADSIIGGAGNDTILGAEGRDIVFGNEDDDYLQNYEGDGRHDLLDGGSGIDAGEIIEKQKDERIDLETTVPPDGVPFPPPP